MRTGSFCFFVCYQINSYSLFSAYQYGSMNTSWIFFSDEEAWFISHCPLPYCRSRTLIRVGFSFQIRRPGIYATAPSPIVSHVHKIAPVYTRVRMVRYSGIHHRKYTVQHTHVKPVDRLAAKVRRLVPSPILLLLP